MGKIANEDGSTTWTDDDTTRISPTTVQQYGKIENEDGSVTWEGPIEPSAPPNPFAQTAGYSTAVQKARRKATRRKAKHKNRTARRW